MISRCSSVLLVAAAIVVSGLLAGLFPAIAFADGGGNTVLDKLGINPNEKPEGYDDRSHNNPYGRDSVTVSPVSELFLNYSANNKLYGHDIPYGEKIQDGDTIQAHVGSIYDGMMAAVGGFGGDGRDNGIAMVGAKIDGGNIKLELTLYDPTIGGTLTGSLTHKKIYNGTLTSFGNSGFDEFENADNYFRLQNYLQLAAGDFNGDGVDEVAVYVAERDNPRIEIYQLTESGGGWEDAGNWSLVFTHRLYDTSIPFAPNMVCLAGADMTGDGVDDLGITWGMYYSEDNYVPSEAVVLHGDKGGEMLRTSSEIRLSYGSGDEQTGLLRASMDVGDADGDGKDELVVAGQSTADVSAEEPDTNTRFLAMYEYREGEFTGVASGNMQGLGTEEEEVKFSGMAYVADLALVRSDGVGTREYIYLDGVIFRQTGPGFTDIRYLYGDEEAPVPFAFLEYGAAAGDFNGDGRETLMLVQVDANEKWLREIDTSGTNTVDEEWEPVLWQYSADSPQLPLAFALPDTDTDSVRLKYTGEHYLAYSEPTVLAAIASPPFFQDLAHLEGGDDYVGSSFTSYGVSEGVKTTDSSYNTISLGAYMAFEQEFEFLGIKAFQVQAEVAFTHGWTEETENYSSNTYAVEYTTFGGQDTVVLYSYPMDVYVYDAYIPQTDSNGNITWEKQTMEVNVPYTPVVKVLPLTAYNPIAAEYGLPDINGELFTHTVGRPETYPASTAGMRDANAAPEYVGMSYGNTTITQSLAYEEGESSGTSQSNSLEAKFGAGAGGAVVGMTLGWESGAGQATTTIEGKTYTGRIFAMPAEAEGYGYDYSWKLVQYIHNGTQNFPVVTYLVNDVHAPGDLPRNLEVHDKTKNSITLGWEAPDDPTVIGYQLYRHHEFPEGTGNYPLGPVIPVEEGKDYYTYGDEGLTPYTEYEYRIQSIRDRNPVLSVLSDVLTARTKALRGEPAIEGPEGVLAVPDRPAELTVTVTKDSENAQDPLYQWQKRIDGAWTDLPGKTNAALTFAQPEAADAGEYRCRVNQIVGEYHITAYSGVARLSFMKHTPAIELDIDANETSTTLEANLSEDVEDLPSGIPPSDYDPGGMVTFNVTGNNSYARIYRADLNNGIARCNWEPPAGGAYEIEVSYGGDRVYYAGSESYTHLAGDEDGYRLEMADSIVYGENLEQSVLEYSRDGETLNETDVTGNFTYTVEGAESKWVAEDGITITAKRVGSYRLTATNKNDAEIVLTEDFTILPRPVNVTAPILSTTQANASQPELIDLLFSSDLKPALAFDDGDDMERLGLRGVLCLDNAGNTVEIDSSTPPGVYTTRVDYIAPPEPDQNYSFSFIDGRYDITGPTYEVTCETELYNGNKVGDIAVVSPSGHEPGDEYQAGTTVVFNATPYPGYSVKEWKVNGSPVEMPANPTLLSLVMGSEPFNVSVSFQITERTLEFRAENGTVTSDDQSLNSGATVVEGATYTFTATPDPGWHFKEWKLTTIGTTQSTTYPAGTLHDDGINTYEFAMPGASCRLEAIFERNSYTLALGENLAAQAGEAGDKTPVNSGDSVVGDTRVTVSAAPGYEVPEDAKWYYRHTDSGDGGDFIEITADNTDFAIENGTCSFNITRDIEITAEVERQNYTVTYQAAEGGSISITVDGQSVDEDGQPYGSGDILPGGAEIVLTVESADGYRFDVWKTNDGSDATFTTAGSVMTVAALDGNLDVSASFEAIPEYDVSIDCGMHGSVEAMVNGNLAEIKDGKLKARQGADVVLTAVPGESFMVESWTIAGNTEYTREKTRELKDVAGDIEIAVTFMAKAYYHVTYGVDGGGGTITAKADGTEFDSPTADKLGGGSELVFTAEPETVNDAVYMVKAWKVTLGEDEPYTAPELSNKFSLTLSDTTDVRVSFEEEKLHTVTSFVYGDGTVSIDGEPDFDREKGLIRDRGTVTFTATPGEGYIIGGLALQTGDREAEPVEGETTEGGAQTYTVASVEDDLQFKAEFVDAYILNFLASTGGSVTASVYGKEIADGALIGVGKRVELTAAAQSGYQFDGWDVVSGNVKLSDTAKETDFIMPGSAVAVTAKFKSKSTGGNGGGDNGDGNNGGDSGAGDGDGGNDSGGAGGGGPPVSPPDIETSKEINSAAGGTVSLGNVSVNIPAGALPGDATVSISKLTQSEAEETVPEGLRLKLSSDVYDITTTGDRDFGDNAITIKIPYDPDQVEDGEAPVILYYDEGTGAWTALETTIEQGEDGKWYAVVKVNHLTRFAVFSTAVSEPAQPEKIIKLTIGSTAAAIDGEPYTLDAASYLDREAGRTLVPIRFVSEALGANVRWDNAARQVAITDGGREIVLTIDSAVVRVDGEKQSINSTPLILPPGRTFVPLRFVSETLGARVDYDNKTKEICITR